jgi:hypothetical protein
MRCSRRSVPPTFRSESKLGLALGPSSSEFLCTLVVPRAFRLETRLPGFRPSSRHHRFASTRHKRTQAPATFRPQAFATSRRFTPRNVPQACFILQPRSGFPSRSGASLLVQPFLPHREKLPPCRFARPSSPAETGCQSNPPRLRGFAPHEGALSHGLVLPIPRLAPLLGFSFPPGVLSPPCLSVPRVAPLMTLPNVISACALVSSDCLQRFSTAILTSRHLCPGQPARNFRAFLTLRFG